MINPKKESKAEKTKVNVGKSLVGIASRQSKDKMVDLVFVIERGEKMKVSVAEIERHLNNVLSVFEESGVDYQLAPIWFQNEGGPKFAVSPFRTDLRAIQEGFYAHFRRDHAAGYGLEAIMRGGKGPELQIGCRQAHDCCHKFAVANNMGSDERKTAACKSDN